MRLPDTPLSLFVGQSFFTFDSRPQILYLQGMKKSKKYIIITNTYLALYKLCASVLVILLLVISSQVTLSAQTNNSETEKNDTIPADKNRYIYLKKRLLLDFDILLQPRQQIYFGPILQIKSNENEYYNVFLDYRRGELQQLIVYSKENLRKLPIPQFKTTSGEQEINIKLTLFQQKKEFIIQLGDTLYTINNLGFNPKAGYKFTFTADKEQVLDPSGNPALQISNIRFIETTDKHIPKSIWYWFVFILIIDLLIFSGVHIRKKLLRRKQTASAVQLENELETIPDSLPAYSPRTTNAIYLFGGFHIYDAEGNNITKKFTPLLKELFLLLVTHTPEKGITSERLKEILWFDKTEQSAKNNRAVNIGKLRSILDTLGENEVSNKTGSWELFLNPETIYIDYYDYLTLYSKGKLSSREDILKLLQLTRQGGFLSDTGYEWLDRFKATVSDYIIDTLVSYSTTSVNTIMEPDLALQIADSISVFDQLNEHALQLRINAYAALGKHSLAKKSYEKFTKEYLNAYGEKFNKSFTDFR